ncbi:N6-adenosine-methyltransferase non-catalytic subunit MTB-like [Mangifera indica]|uniref:N6-adenosine-methyltransferase non-catalytic subunit MTB-like n=1 Tax=Mangifera indica TaxID=29780 RepID=UPI001CFABF0D|nr:N6-adenosine-methyltransferase non-catalytic subunit MTB-like [Mangifera indica]XP_044468409.1 N6-adenosine-methyltransferase non-catalytic subunit MTB-like [Mangifera indica]XP_044468410.1 N6-adenosine-methyltransferase non-catalytic subunit MTB-like [Mangifera indica]XP_044468411.1 N6-adenosine-methyltransferase non-catalytic subunit MTB-like [Mangifera indica]XP_044468412.1 N6-adenosine-methyltransferase non-catalytic subunit MTB-like [Mangifera indica]XP_044468413.1 N6-adenosine-methylt
MGSPERSRSHAKRDIEDGMDMKKIRDRDDEEWEGNDKRKHRSTKSRKLSNGEEIEGLDGSGRRRSSGDRNESCKRSGGSSRADSHEDEYDTRKEQRSKQLKKKQEESSLEQLSSWYQDGEVDNRKDGGDKSGSRGHNRVGESERRKTTSKLLEHDSFQSGNKNKDERLHDAESEKTLDKDSRYSERRESGQEKVHDSSDKGRNSRRRWDESDALNNVEENLHERADLRSGKASDTKYEISKGRSASARHESSESKNKGLDSNSEKGVKSNNREERRVDIEKSKSKGRSEALEEENRGSPNHHEDRSGWDKNEKSRHQRTPSGRDVGEGRERPSNKDDDGNAWTKRSNRSRTPERSGRRHLESEYSEVDFERSNDIKRKEIEKDSNRDERSKARDDSWSDRNRDREGSKENWKRRQTSSNDKELKDGEIFYDRGREWELPRHSHDQNDHERPHGRSSTRKDGSRSEAVKTSSKFGISNENYDVIEIQTKPLDYGRAESGPNFSRRTEVGPQSDVQLAPNEQEWAYMREDRAKRTDMYGSGHSGEDSRDRYVEDGRDTNSWRDDIDYQGGKGRGQKGALSGRNAGSASSSQPPYENQEAVPFGRGPPQGVKGSRAGRGGRGRPTGRDNQQMGVPLPIMGSHFGPLGMPPPGSMQSITPAPGLPINPSVFIPPFPAPVVWPGPRGVDMNMLGVPPSLSPVPPGPSGPRFAPNIGTPTNPGMYFNQAGLGRGGPPSTSGPGFNAAGPIVRGTPPDKSSGGWAPPRTVGATGKAPSRGEQNDYSQNFVDTGMRPQNFIRELELTNVVEDYPKLRELIQKKDEIVSKSATAPMYFKCDLREFELSPEFFGTKFDVILVDPPWEEYVHRAPGVADHMEYWTFEEILNLKIEAIADTPSFIFLWVGDGAGLEQGRQCLKKWGFRRCEDICWVKTNKNNATAGLRHGHTLFQHSKEHCLMGIKGTVRRSTDGHIIHANIDTDVIIAEEPPYGSTRKPEDMYRIIEHFALGRRRLELFGEDHNIRAGWLTVGDGISSSNFNKEAYTRKFADKDGKVWQGGGGRNPPPEAPHLVVTTPEIEALRPKSPMKNQQQQQQSTSISVATSIPSGRRAAGNSPQNPGGLGLNLEASSSNPSTPVPWASPMEGFQGRDIGNMPSEDKYFDLYGYTGQANGDYPDFESQRPLNLL